MSWLKRGGLVLLGLLVLSLGYGYYLLGSEEVPQESDFRLDPSALRSFATAIPGPLPESIHSEVVVESEMPRAAMMAGESFDGTPMIYAVYQVRYPDGRFILIDSGMDEAMAQDMPTPSPAEFDRRAASKIERALEQAWQIVITHEHGDHIGGIAKHPRPEALASALRLTAEQQASDFWLDAVDFPQSLRELEALRYEDLQAIAPGVVLVKSPGHTPGSQMVFVKLADGRDFLFIGDVAWNRDALTELKYRPRFITDWMLGENRAQVMAQYRTLHEVMKHRKLQVVTAHDPRDRIDFHLDQPFP